MLAWENAPCAAQPGRETQTAAGKEAKGKKISPEGKEGRTEHQASCSDWQLAEGCPQVPAPAAALLPSPLAAKTSLQTPGIDGKYELNFGFCFP